MQGAAVGRDASLGARSTRAVSGPPASEVGARSIQKGILFGGDNSRRAVSGAFKKESFLFWLGAPSRGTIATGLLPSPQNAHSIAWDAPAGDAPLRGAALGRDAVLSARSTRAVSGPSKKESFFFFGMGQQQARPTAAVGGRAFEKKESFLVGALPARHGALQLGVGLFGGVNRFAWARRRLRGLAA